MKKKTANIEAEGDLLMIIFDLAVQGPQNRASVLRNIQHIASSASFSRITGLFAYATAGGVELLVDGLNQHMKQWNAISKRWIVSIDFATTEPMALTRLLSLKNSGVKVPYFAEVLKRKFNPITCFHAKTIILDTPENERGPLGLIVSSANLTVSGLSIGHENSISMMWKKTPLPNSRSPWGALVEEIKHVETVIDMSTPLNSALIREYERKRTRKRIKIEDDSIQVKRLMEDLPEMPFTRTVALATSQHLWVETGYIVENRGPGIPGNQIDLQRGMRVFFGFGVGQVPLNTVLGNVRIVYGSSTVDCHMRFGNNQMDKLNLPVPGVEGPPDYKNKTLLFSRRPEGSFLLKVGSLQEVKRWKKVSHSQGKLYKMKGGREYGVFD